MCANATDASSKARLQAVSAPESGLWLNALPLSSIGLHMDDTTIQVAVGLRLGLLLCYPHSCRHCDGNVDEFATHSLSYRCSGTPSPLLTRLYSVPSLLQVCHLTLSLLDLSGLLGRNQMGSLWFHGNLRNPLFGMLSVLILLPLPI